MGSGLSLEQKKKVFTVQLTVRIYPTARQAPPRQNVMSRGWIRPSMASATRLYNNWSITHTQVETLRHKQLRATDLL